MNMKTLKEQIIAANKAYRIGRPIMSDIEFDNLCEEYERTVSEEEYSEFRDSLHEETGKVHHPFVMGSLDKLKIEEPEDIADWVRKFKVKNLSVSAKVDGISCRLHYNEHNQLVSATTRGDGYFGQDITDKIRYVKGVVDYLNYTNPKFSKPYDIRGELVILNEDFDEIKDILKNPRNACAGIMGQKEADPNMLKYITFIAYEIMGGEFEKDDQFDILDDFGFYVVHHTTIDIAKVLTTDALCSVLTKWITNDFGYPTDGVVISSTDYKAEDVYRPKAQKAVKISNMLAAKTELIDVVWEKPSKNGRITPVGIVNPVELGGATVSRVTLNNVDWINQIGLRIGSRVEITRSNGVIPKIINVETAGNKDIELPLICPECGGSLTMVGVDICCKNPNCRATGIAKVLSFLRNLDIKHVSLKTLENLGIDTFEKLFAFKADKNYKVQTRFENDLRGKLWNGDELTLFKALPFRNVAEKTLDKIIDFYGWESIKSNPTNFFNEKATYPIGVGEKILTAFVEILKTNLDILNSIINDHRWTGHKAGNVKTSNHAMQGTVCFTGKLENFSRKDAAKFAENHGFSVLSSVGRDLTYLVTNSSEMTSKMKNAIKFGTKIITEDEFLNLCK